MGRVTIITRNMPDYTSLYDLMRDTPPEKWSEQLPEQLEQLLAEPHGNYERWREVLHNLPYIECSDVDFNSDNLQVKTNNTIELQQGNLSIQGYPGKTPRNPPGSQIDAFAD